MSSRNPNDGVTDAEIEDYGPELISVIERKARATTAGQVNYLNQEIQNLKGRLANDGKKNMMAELDRELQNWRMQNTDAAYHTWLGQVDPLSGRTRQALLTEAWQAQDVPRVKALFNGYRVDAAAGRAPVTQQAPQEIYQGRDGAYYRGSPGAGNASGTLTTGEIRRFYDEVRRGLWNQRPADKQATELRIIEAGKRGLVRGK